MSVFVSYLIVDKNTNKVPTYRFWALAFVDGTKRSCARDWWYTATVSCVGSIFAIIGIMSSTWAHTHICTWILGIFGVVRHLAFQPAMRGENCHCTLIWRISKVSPTFSFLSCSYSAYSHHICFASSNDVISHTPEEKIHAWRLLGQFHERFRMCLCIAHVITYSYSMHAGTDIAMSIVLLFSFRCHFIRVDILTSWIPFRCL